jgi:hypothetical protein
MNRDTIFISHATPDDNEFVRWLGTRLTGHGYRVWADLFDLKGGTPFWTTIEDAIRTRAIKVLFVVSHKSVDPNRSGVRNELSVADTIKKLIKDPGFIIPVKIDDTGFGDLPIQIHQLNAIDFAQGWGAKLLELLKTLEDARVPQSRNPNEGFEIWRNVTAHAATLVESASERVVSNLMPVEGLPKSIGFYEYDGDKDKVAAAIRNTGLPFAPFNRLIISFAGAEAFQESLPPAFRLKVRAHVPFETFLAGGAKDVTAPAGNDARNIATSLLRQHIERHLVARGLKRFETASSSSFYFPSGLAPNDKISFVAASGRKTPKNVVGRSDKYKVNWHLAMKVNIVLGPPALVRLKPYICFSEDGQNAINDPKRTARIRKSFCRNWWNPQWRQLQEAFCTFLAKEKPSIEIGLDGQESLVLASRPIELVAARSMPDDLKVADEPDDPVEPDDDPDDDLAEDETEDAE